MPGHGARGAGRRRRRIRRARGAGRPRGGRQGRPPLIPLDNQRQETSRLRGVDGRGARRSSHRGNRPRRQDSGVVADGGAPRPAPKAPPRRPPPLGARAATAPVTRSAGSPAPRVAAPPALAPRGGRAAGAGRPARRRAAVARRAGRSRAGRPAAAQVPPAGPHGPRAAARPRGAHDFTNHFRRSAPQGPRAAARPRSAASPEPRNRDGRHAVPDFCQGVVYAVPVDHVNVPLVE